MVGLKAIFFDAGGTIVFPDPTLTLAPLLERGIFPSQEQLYAAEGEAKHRLDEAHTHGISSVDASYWDFYYAALLQQLRLEDAALRTALVAATRRGMNWRYTRPRTREVLQQLHARFRMGVISNSDGSVARLLDEVGLHGCFDSITDSHHCGCEKPDPRIFQAAMDSLDATGDTSLYVGDIYSVDYLGARGCGMRAVLMDPAGAYAKTAYPRVESLEQLEQQLLSGHQPSPVSHH